MILCMPIFVKVGTPHNYTAYAASETSENACKAYTIRGLQAGSVNVIASWIIVYVRYTLLVSQE